jgi:hypothetical protein
MFQEPLSHSTVGPVASSMSGHVGPILSGLTLSDSHHFDFTPATVDQLAGLKRDYASLLIQLDHLRPLLASADVLYRPSDDEWSIKELLGHLIDSDRDIWWPRILALKNSDGAVFNDVDQQDLVTQHRWQTLPIEDILAQLMRVRWDYAMQLNAIPEKFFERSGTHSTLGTISMLDIVQILVTHDTLFLEKIRGLIEEARNSVSY